MTLSEKQRKFSKLLAEFILKIYDMGFEVTFGHVYRDTDTQKRMVEAGLSKIMQSKHCDRLAVDFNIWVGKQYTSDPQAYRPLGELWEKMGGSWGGRFGVKTEEYNSKVGWDSNHFEWRG
mgnify:FL=1